MKKIAKDIFSLIFGTKYFWPHIRPATRTILVALISIVVVAGWYSIYSGHQSLKHQAKATVSDIKALMASDIAAIRFDTGLVPDWRKHCFAVTDPNGLQFLTQSFSAVDTDSYIGRTKVDLEASIEVQTANGHSVWFLATVVEVAPNDVHVRPDRFYRNANGQWVERYNERVRIPELGKWLINEFVAHGCM